MTSLKIGPLPKVETVRLLLALPKPLKNVLDLYSAEHSRRYGPTETAALLPHMLEAFIRSDREFMRQHGKAVRELFNPSSESAALNSDRAP